MVRQFNRDRAGLLSASRKACWLNACSRCLSFNHALGYLQRVSGPQILRESRRRIEDTTEPKKGKKIYGKQILCFRTKSAHIEQLLFDPIGPFSYVLSH